jgi:hypothetical protein
MYPQKLMPQHSRMPLAFLPSYKGGVNAPEWWGQFESERWGQFDRILQFDNIDIMFYTGVTAYPWFPDVNVIDSLSELGYQFYAFNSHNEYVLPEKVKVNPNVILINEALK